LEAIQSEFLHSKPNLDPVTELTSSPHEVFSETSQKTSRSLVNFKWLFISRTSSNLLMN